ncbi:hypothetical protein N8D74_10055 [Curtobacterium flaccumfaciens]|uniref:Uncharacterized protein n=1 Tax=Curtobacterium poinsettiae TaxID=159612 RepID=A0A9Q9T4M4_9MICO|nr:hypothetical protein [Curtobacterium flaccumfaciens]UXN23927.1 hypothetical protein N8D74_10055 [Curtobacterium flaccumfaciens]UYC82042.1 hypothetical protein OE229_06140 [Curtobacterium flaccumfaciens pv. poinsettiae]
MFDGEAQPGWFDWLGIALAVIGFGIGWWQLHKTTDAAEVATTALAKARKKLVFDQLAAVQGQVSSVIADLDFAIDSNDREVAHRALLRFSYAASEIRALLAAVDEEFGDYFDLTERFASSSGTALDVKANIVGRPSPDIARLAKAVTKEIRSVSVSLDNEIAKGRYELGDSANV